VPDGYFNTLPTLLVGEWWDVTHTWTRTTFHSVELFLIVLNTSLGPCALMNHSSKQVFDFKSCLMLGSLPFSPASAAFGLKTTLLHKCLSVHPPGCDTRFSFIHASPFNSCSLHFIQLIYPFPPTSSASTVFVTYGVAHYVCLISKCWHKEEHWLDFTP